MNAIDATLLLIGRYADRLFRSRWIQIDKPFRQLGNPIACAGGPIALRPIFSDGLPLSRNPEVISSLRTTPITGMVEFVRETIF
jgi:hypothetical protein